MVLALDDQEVVVVVQDILVVVVLLEVGVQVEVAQEVLLKQVQVIIHLGQPIHREMVVLLLPVCLIQGWYCI